MGFYTIFVIVSIAVMTILLILEVARPEKIIFFTLVLFLFSGLITPAQALQGFANEGVWTIAILFIITGVVQQSDVLSKLLVNSLNKSKNQKRSLLKMMVPTTFLSAFLNNTPIVMYLIPIVRKWAQERGYHPSKFLIPISYAAVFGGTVTLIGTSTNLVVHGIMLKEGLDGFSMFQFAWIGIPASLLALLYMSTIGFRLLPERIPSEQADEEADRHYLTEAIVEAGCPLIGQELRDTQIFRLKGLDLVEIVRKNKWKVAPIQGDEVIEEGDRLIFTGRVSTIQELQRIKHITIELGSGLRYDDLAGGNVRLVELVISQSSDLAYKPIKETSFRMRYDASIVSVNRNQIHIENKIGDIVLRPGDVILVLADAQFEQKYKDSGDFFFLSSSVTMTVELPKAKMIFNFAVFGLMIVLAGFQLLTMFQASLLALCLFLVTKSIRSEDIKSAIDFPTLLLIACSIGIGSAMTESGVAEYLAGVLGSVTESFGIIGALIAIFLLTNLLTELVTNTAAAVIIFPIALELSNLLQVEPVGMMLVLAIAASSSFSTPIGYQTNLMVYGPGGYKFFDYLKVGLPLNLLFMAVTVTMTYWVYFAG